MAVACESMTVLGESFVGLAGESDCLVLTLITMNVAQDGGGGAGEGGRGCMVKLSRRYVPCSFSFTSHTTVGAGRKIQKHFNNVFLTSVLISLFPWSSLFLDDYRAVKVKVTEKSTTMISYSHHV